MLDNSDKKWIEETIDRKVEEMEQHIIAKINDVVAPSLKLHTDLFLDRYTSCQRISETSQSLEHRIDMLEKSLHP